MQILVHKDSKISFEVEKELPEGFVKAKDGLNSHFMKFGTFPLFSFKLSVCREATQTEVDDFLALKDRSVHLTVYTSKEPINDLRIYGKEYHLWRERKYLGIATWQDDENIGEAFIREVLDDAGELVSEVYVADSWTFV